MKDNEFKEKLSQVADWNIPDIKLEGYAKRKKQEDRVSEEEQYQHDFEIAFYEMYGGKNPTFPPQVSNIKCRDEVCGDCGKLCQGGRKMEHKKYFKQDESIWRHKCLNCNRVQDPVTKEFSLGTYQANRTWNVYLNQKGYRRYKQK